MSVSPSVPEPDPKPEGVVVPDALHSVLMHTKDIFLDETPDFKRAAVQELDHLIALVKERDAFGRAKYGQPLMSNDGRNGIEDARQELGDLLQYVMKCKLAGQDLSDFMRLVSTATLVMRIIAKS